jgi:hypothetical protein
MSEANPAVVEAELLAARQALAARVVRYDDRLAHALSSCLHLLAVLHDGLAEDAGSEVAGSAKDAARALAGAARLITFTSKAEDRRIPLHPHAWGSIPTRPTGPLLDGARRLLGEPDSATQRKCRELLDHLEELLRDAIFTADTQGYVDANANEVAYLRAATLISRAASLVAAAGCCGR